MIEAHRRGFPTISNCNPFRRILRRVPFPRPSQLKLVDVKPLVVSPADLTGYWTNEKGYLVHKTPEKTEIFGNGSEGVIFEKDKNDGSIRTFKYSTDDFLDSACVVYHDGTGYYLNYCYEERDEEKRLVSIEKQDFRTIGPKRINVGQPQRIK